MARDEEKKNVAAEWPMNTRELLIKHLGQPTRVPQGDGTIEGWRVCPGAELECLHDGIYFKGLYPEFSKTIPKRLIYAKANNPERSLVALIAKLRRDVPKALEIECECIKKQTRLKEVARVMRTVTGYHVSTGRYDRIVVSIGLGQAEELLKKFP